MRIELSDEDVERAQRVYGGPATNATALVTWIVKRYGNGDHEAIRHSLDADESFDVSREKAEKRNREQKIEWQKESGHDTCS